MKRKIIPYNPNLKLLARQLRNHSTPGESILWKELSNKKMAGFDFHRQKPLLNYIADFFCHELNLVIEIDGNYHNHEEQYNLDVARESELSRYGLKVLRFAELEVRTDMVNVLRTIQNYIADFTADETLL